MMHVEFRLHLFFELFFQIMDRDIAMFAPMIYSPEDILAHHVAIDVDSCLGARGYDIKEFRVESLHMIATDNAVTIYCRPGGMIILNLSALALRRVIHLEVLEVV